MTGVQTCALPISKFASYAAATTAPAADQYGAARDSWAAAQAQYGNAVAQQNQNLAQSNNTRQGNIGLLGLGLSALGNKNIMSGLGSAWNGISNFFGSGSGGGAVNTGMSGQDADLFW